MQPRQIRSVTLAAIAAAVLAQGALAAGEPKNERPFTRPIDTSSLSQAPHQANASPPIRGEAKNETPFTRAVAHAATTRANETADPGGPLTEPKNQPPFTRHVSTPTTVIVQRRGRGFSLTDTAIGAVAGIGIALCAAAALALSRKSPRLA